MRGSIHPGYGTATVTCACGNTWQTRATRPALRVEACSACHPVFLGEERRVQATGRIERFRRRYAVAHRA